MENLSIVKVVNKDKVYTDQKGKEHCSVNYYLVCGKTYIAIRPSFSKGYAQLDLLSNVIVNGSEKIDGNKN